MKSDVSSKICHGIIAGSASAIFTSPLDMIKTTRQIGYTEGIIHTAKNIFSTYGIQGFFKGLGANMFSVSFFYGTFFPVYDFLKRKEYLFSRDSPYSHFSNSIIAGSIGSIVANPIYVLKIRKQTNHKNKSLKNIFHKEGASSLYRGFGITLIKNFEIGIQLPIYEFLKKKEYDTVYSSFISKFISTTITYPIDTLRVIIRGTREHDKNLLHLLKDVYAKDGIRGFFRGYMVNTIRSVPSAVIVFTIYEWLKNIKNEKNDILIKKI